MKQVFPIFLRPGGCPDPIDFASPLLVLEPAEVLLILSCCEPEPMLDYFCIDD